MRLRIRIAAGIARNTMRHEALFDDIFLPAHHSWLARLSSVVLHILLVAVVPRVADMLTPTPAQSFPWSRYEVRPLKLRVPLYFEKASAEAVEAPPKQAARTGRRQPAAAAPESAPEAPGKDQVARRHFSLEIELPHVPAIRDADSVILQPAPSLPNTRPEQMPSLAFWARQTPKSPPKPFVSPGRTEAPSKPPELDAPPSLAIANRQPNVSDLNINPVASVQAPALPVPPSSTNPVRMPKDSPEKTESGSIDAGEGEAANLIALGQAAVPANRMLNVPPVNQAPLQGGAGASASAGAAAAARTAGAAGSERASSSSRKAEAGAGTRAADGNGRSGSGEGSGSDAGANGRQQPSGSGATDTAQKTALAREKELHPLATVEPAPDRPRSVVGAADGVRQGLPSPVQGALTAAARPAGSTAAVRTDAVRTDRVDLPKDGRFSFVVTGPAESYPEARGALSGKVVYTVSVRVGTRKPWVMQYCLPLEVEQKLGLRASSVALEAPFPYLIFRLLASSEPEAKRLVVHGYVNIAGKFEQLSLVGDVEFPEKQALLSSLAQWEFRPASRDGQATAVEVLLIIPREAV